MSKFLTFTLLVLFSVALASCSYFMRSNEGPLEVSHGYVQGVSPSNAQGFRNRTYPTIEGNWDGPGGSSTWLAVNLGAQSEPLSSTDTTPSHAGWMFQFNKRQAFYHDGSTLIPQWRFSSIVENSEWELVNDPCYLLLGESWRVPTIEEYRAFREAPRNRGGMGEGNRTDAFNSSLQLHSGGELVTFDGGLRSRGENGRYWSRDQFSPRDGEAFGFDPEGSGTFGSNKAFARPVRCIRE